VGLQLAHDGRLCRTHLRRPRCQNSRWRSGRPTYPRTWLRALPL
jgi:hypothetical protein